MIIGLGKEYMVLDILNFFWTNLFGNLFDFRQCFVTSYQSGQVGVFGC